MKPSQPHGERMKPAKCQAQVADPDQNAMKNPQRHQCKFNATMGGAYCSVHRKQMLKAKANAPVFENELMPARAKR